MSNECLMYKNGCYQNKKCVHSLTLTNDNHCALGPSDRCMSAGQVLEATKIKVTGRMKKALENVALEKEASREKKVPCDKEVKGESSSAPDRGAALPTVDPLFKGVSPALLERVGTVCMGLQLVLLLILLLGLVQVQAREAARAKASMTRNPKQEKELGILMRLPEFCRILRSYPFCLLPLMQHLNEFMFMQPFYLPCRHFFLSPAHFRLFVTEKKAALEWEYVVQKLVDSHPSSLSDGETVGCIDYIVV